MMVADLSVSQTMMVIPIATMNILISVLLLSLSPRMRYPINADKTGETASMRRVIATVVVVSAYIHPKNVTDITRLPIKLHESILLKVWKKFLPSLKRTKMSMTEVMIKPL